MDLPCIFNCSNDMALAVNVRQYVPPKRIRQMEADLADLARVWEGTRFAGPWGWSLATKQRYRQMGVPEEALPTDAWLAEVRQLSSRKFAWFYLKQMLGTLKDGNLLGWDMQWVDALTGDVDANNAAMSSVTSQEAYTSCTPCRTRHVRCIVHDVYACQEHGARVSRSPFPVIFKSPWSSSGRGVFVSDTLDGHTQKRLQGFLSSQGGFVMDEFHKDKVLDFAMEFFVTEDHRVDFLGYSVFSTGAHGAYGYNAVDSQEALLRRIDVDERLLQQLIDYHCEHLAKTAYCGPVGVDMLKTADGRVHPCLEINLRMNMGILALLLFERYGSNATIALTPPRPLGFQALVDKGRLKISYVPSSHPTGP